MLSFKKFLVLLESSRNDVNSSRQEQEVADEIRSHLEKLPDSSDHNGTAERNSGNNQKSDVHVHLNKNNKDFFVEVKLDDKSSPVAKYSATFTGGSLHFNFSRLSKAYDNKESEDRESSNFEEIMSVQAQDWFKEINTIVSKDLKLGMQKLKDLLNSHIDDIISKSRKNGWKDHSIIDGRSKTKMNKVVGLDIGDETGTSKFIDVDFSDVGIENVPVPQIKKLSKLKIHNVEFPKIFNRLVEFFDICDEMHNTKYMILRKRAIESSDGNIKPYLEKILKPSKRISQDEFMTIKKWIDGIQDDGTVSIDQEGPDGKTIVIDERTLGTLKQISSLFTMYTEIVNQRNAYWKSKSEAYSKNPNVRNLEKSRGVTVYSDEELNRLQNVQSLAEMQYWEKIRYLYNVLIGINKPPEDGMYDPDVFNHGVSLYNGRFDRDSDIFKSLMNTIVNYYSKGLGVQYVQCGDDLYSIGSKDDLDISSEKNEKNGIYDFTQSFKSLDCNLFVHTRDNMTMILYVVLNKGDIESRTSFTTIKPFPEVK